MEQMYSSELRKIVTLEKFKQSYSKFIEQADKNAITMKSQGSSTPFGFSEKPKCDGFGFENHFGQGGASTTPFMNWWVVSIYYIPKTGNIIVGIEEKLYPLLNKMKPICFKLIGNKNTRVAVFYETAKSDIDYNELYMHFINVSEDIMQLNRSQRVNSDSPNNEVSENTMSYNKNIILYGPPGTGKTYNTVNYAVAIIENKKLEEVQSENYDEVFARFKLYKNDKRISFTTFHQSFGYEEFIEGIRPVMNENEEAQDVRYEISNGIFKKFCENAKTPLTTKENYVFIIDEINRGNISKILGELITLIEPSKRLGQPEEATAILPYSKKQFGVPDNVYIIGTMNTADRSVQRIDTALRRRFAFKEMLPDTDLLKDVEIDGINIANMLDNMNKKISVLFDREHTIGHAYFIDLLKEENQNIKALGNIFKNNIIPLLQEYFYEDYEKIRLVLGDNRKKDNGIPFVQISNNNDCQDLFGDNLDIDIPYRYEINEKAFYNAEAYKFI